VVVVIGTVVVVVAIGTMLRLFLSECCFGWFLFGFAVAKSRCHGNWITDVTPWRIGVPLMRGPEVCF
jgi:hypothetical protein